MARASTAVARRDDVDDDDQAGGSVVVLAGVTAAAARIDGSDRDQRDAERSRRRRSDARAARVWEHYDDCGELWYGTEFIGNSFSRIRLYAGRREADGAVSPVVPPETDQETDGGATQPDPPPPLTPAEQAARDAVDRLRSASGGQSELMRGFGRLLSLVGDSNLVGYERPPAEGTLPVEVWDVLSTDELVLTDSGYVRKTEPGGSAESGEQLPEDALTLRVWRPHPRWSNVSTAPTFAVLDRLDELAILSRMIRAQARSRIANAGILVVPSEVDPPKDPSPKPEGGGSAVASPFLADLITHFVTPIADEGSASAVVPYLIKLPSEYCDKVRHFALERPIDKIAIEERKELIQRIANGLDLPAEVMTGLGQSNHWSAWLIDDSTFRSHLEPLVLLVCNSLTTGYLRPTLEADNHDPTGLCIWYDASDLVVHPDRAKDALACHTAIALSDAALRKYHGFTEDDAPSDEERLLRLVLHRGAPDPGIAQEIIRRLDPTLPVRPIEPDSGGGNGTPPSNGQAPSGSPDHRPPPAEGPPASGPPAEQAARSRRLPLGLLAAARRPVRLATLGGRLANIDRGLMTRLQVEADATLRRALERAGGRVRTAANARRDRTVQDALRACANPEAFCTRLGPALVAALGMSDQELLAGSIEAFGPRFSAQLSRAQQRALADVAAVADLDEESLTGVRARQDQDREAAWFVLLTALSTLAAAQLYDPAAGLDDRGELDAELRVPAGLIREAMARAGGAEGVFVDAGTAPAGLVATGTVVTDVLAANGITAAGYVWDYGDPGARKSPFPAHEDLDGVAFAGWDDPILAAPADADWLASPFVWPGDHAGCACIAQPNFDQPTTEED